MNDGIWKTQATNEITLKCPLSSPKHNLVTLEKRARGLEIREPFHISFFGEDIFTKKSGVYWYIQVLKPGKP